MFANDRHMASQLYLNNVISTIKYNLMLFAAAMHVYDKRNRINPSVYATFRTVFSSLHKHSNCQHFVDTKAGMVLLFSPEVRPQTSPSKPLPTQKQDSACEQLKLRGHLARKVEG